ncbi:MAG: hypothetical protein VYC17_03035 [Nitrospinota bacterium]|nr:hypothetical protein [Nitrospinota bacterium]
MADRFDVIPLRYKKGLQVFFPDLMLLQVGGYGIVQALWYSEAMRYWVAHLCPISATCPC